VRKASSPSSFRLMPSFMKRFLEIMGRVYRGNIAARGARSSDGRGAL
jgi:hypothetical protein